MNNQSSISRAFASLRPSTPTTVIRAAFGLESALFLLVSGSFLLDTDALLTTGFARTPTFVTPLALCLARMWGSNALALTLPLAYGATTQATARERRGVYWTLLAADTAMLTTAAVMWVRGMDGGLQAGLGWQLALAQLVPLGWRAWCLFVKPQWFGEEGEKGIESNEKA
jgi:hypothetical protein